MAEDRVKILQEKIQYLISMALTEKKFEVMSIDADISTYTPKTTGSEPPKTLIEEYYIVLVVDYKGSLDSYDPYAFTRDIKNICESMRDCVTEYTITKNGKIVNSDVDVYASDAFILNIDFKSEELHKFTVSFSFRYPD
jgi:hypothetical protein